MPLLHRKHIFLLFLTILGAYSCWANFRNMCSINMTLKKINTRSVGLCNYLVCQVCPNYITTRHLKWIFTCEFSPAPDTHLAHSRYLIQSCRIKVELHECRGGMLTTCTLRCNSDLTDPSPEEELCSFPSSPPAVILHGVLFWLNSSTSFGSLASLLDLLLFPH